MIQKPPISDQSIIECLNTYYDINVTALTFLPLGADENAAVYKAHTQDSSYFVKLKRDHNEIGVIIQTLLHEAGIKPIISPVKTNTGQLTQHVHDFTVIVYPFIEGQDGFSCALTNGQWITLGQSLRLVHAFDVPPVIKNQIKQETYCPKWREAVRSVYAHIDDQSIHGDDITLQLLTFMKEHKNIIQRLVDRAEQLAHKIQTQSPQMVLCHADIHGGNVLIENDDTFYIVDWDQPIMAPKERDLMFIGGGVGNVWNDPHEVELFYLGYGKTEIDRDILAYYRHERIVEDIAFYAQALLLTIDGGQDRPVMYKHFMDMFEPRGVVEIAFASDTTI
ncbi:MAG TPA: aminoglycoside phosphotransferase family protein [Candidatus Babeliales bacterium]|nr:aminoglycoside phosphotransferase family protein [Candidatus Babeliales bacterium]